MSFLTSNVSSTFANKSSCLYLILYFGLGNSKQQAEQEAANNLLKNINLS